MPNTSWILKKQNNPRVRIMALFSYMAILCLVPLIFNKDKDEFIDFHVRQGLVLWIWGVISMFGLYIPIIGHFFFVSSNLIIAVFAVVGVVSVVLNRTWSIPIIGVVARKL
jgi:fumarate reductase subunit D